MPERRIEPMREADSALRSAAFAAEFRLAVPSYAHKDFAILTSSSGAAPRDIAGGMGPRCAESHVKNSGHPRQSHNDLEMLSFAGIPVVMGNSVPA